MTIRASELRYMHIELARLKIETRHLKELKVRVCVGGGGGGACVRA